MIIIKENEAVNLRGSKGWYMEGNRRRKRKGENNVIRF